jgi:hypothetical protein
MQEKRMRFFFAGYQYTNFIQQYKIAVPYTRQNEQLY